MAEKYQTLAYRYRLNLLPAQEDAVERVQDQLRPVWNHLVREQRWAEREWRFGRAGSVVKKLLADRLVGKHTGNAGPKAERVAAEKGVSKEEAYSIFRKEEVAEKSKIIRRGKKAVNPPPDSRNLRCSRRRLASAYASAHVNEVVDQYLSNSISAGVYKGLREKFEACCDNYVKSIFKRPRFKRRGDPVTVQRQVTKTARFDLAPTCDLSSLCGQALGNCPVILHRPLPSGAAIKQIAISGKRTCRYLIIMFSAPAQPAPGTKPPPPHII